ncbi:Glycosyl transferase, group 1 [Minicystis rosea]|nr:Glycosyl transferase, group 1 [Minicystis rosea]
MPRTLLVGQAAQPTGMARVLHALAGRLAAHREVHALGIDVFPGSAACPGRRDGGYVLHGNPRDWDMLAERELPRLVAALRPDTVVLYHDPWYVPRLRRAIGDTGARVIAYCPVDGEILQTWVATELAVLDGLVVPTRFAARAIRACVEGTDLAGRTPFDRMMVLPHGMDGDDFQPWGGSLEDASARRLAARRALFPDRPERWSGFWTLNVNRNHARKRLDLTVRGFASFAAGKPSDVLLFLPWGDDRTGVDVKSLARTLDIADRLVVPSPAAGVSTERLNLLYNAADVGVNTSTGEGWGLPSFEHAATGAAQIVPAHSACGELWSSAAEVLPVRRTLTLSGLLQGGEVEARDVADALSRLYHDAPHRERMALAAYEVAHQDAYRWDRIAAGWHAYLGEHEAARR